MNRPYIVCHMMTSVDGRIDCEMTSKFDGLPMDQEIIPLQLKDVTKYDDGTLWIRYITENN